MKVPEEFVEDALEAGFGIPASTSPLNRENMRRALEAVLPKVRERLLEGEAIRKAALANCPDEQRWEKKREAYEWDAHINVQAAFDHAFPEQGAMPELQRWEEVVSDLRADAKSARESAAEIEINDGKDKGYGIKISVACAFEIAADRIAGEIEELRHA